MEDYVLVTSHDKVDVDDFYLTDEKWLKNNPPSDLSPDELRQMAKDGELFEAYIVPALQYCIYRTMDAQQVFINLDDEVVMLCEGAIINNDQKDCWEYNY